MKICSFWLIVALATGGCDSRQDAPVAKSARPEVVLNADYCLSPAGEEHYGNTKACAMEACDKGDKASCEIAREFAVALGPDDGTSTAANVPTKLEGMDYNQARQFILSRGWLPVEGGCDRWMGEETCTRYPETKNCSGVELGLCDMQFERKDRCLVIVTLGGPPEPKIDGEPAVRDVTFLRGACPAEDAERAAGT